MPIRIEAGSVSRFDELGEAWRALEARAPRAPLFQGWTWMGCLAQERFPNPVLVRAEVDGELAGLALFNRRRGRLHLSESGDPRLDAPFIEHNAPLIAEGAPPGLLRGMLRAAWRSGLVWGMALSGVPPEVAAAAGGWVWRRQERAAPYVDLDAVRAAGGDLLATLSANARQQIRRSLRALAARGEVRLDRARDEAEALSWFEEMAALHQARWRERGRPGAFADPFMPRFHRALIARGLPRGEIDLLRGSAGGESFGYLYNLRRGGWICAYQGGWLGGAAAARERPGLLCHVLAIEAALTQGAVCYDFLAGAARDKESLAASTRPLLWTKPWRLG